MEDIRQATCGNWQPHWRYEMNEKQGEIMRQMLDELKQECFVCGNWVTVCDGPDLCTHSTQIPQASNYNEYEVLFDTANLKTGTKIEHDG